MLPHAVLMFRAEHFTYLILGESSTNTGHLGAMNLGPFVGVDLNL